MQVGIRKTENRQGKGWYKALILVIGWLLIFSLARDIWQIRSGFNRITEANRRLEAEEAKNIALRDKLSLVMTESYKERLIREKLNMQKEGETIVILGAKSQEQAYPGEDKEKISVANWEKWWNLIK